MGQIPVAQRGSATKFCLCPNRGQARGNHIRTLVRAHQAAATPPHNNTAARSTTDHAHSCVRVHARVTEAAHLVCEKLSWRQCLATTAPTCHENKDPRRALADMSKLSETGHGKDFEAVEEELQDPEQKALIRRKTRPRRCSLVFSPLRGRGPTILRDRSFFLLCRGACASRTAVRVVLTPRCTMTMGWVDEFQSRFAVLRHSVHI